MSQESSYLCLLRAGIVYLPLCSPTSVYSELVYYCACNILYHSACLVVGFVLVFHKGSGIKLRYSCLQGKTLFNWVITPTLIYACRNKNKTVISVEGYAHWLLYCLLKDGESCQYITKSRKLKYLQVTGLEKDAMLGSSQLCLRQLYNSHHLSITEGQNQSLQITLQRGKRHML